MIDSPALPERFWQKVTPEPNSGCWLWTGATIPEGYGSFGVKGRHQQGAHRVSYEALCHQIPRGFHIDHLCRTPSCVNPAHLEAVTPGENTRRGRAGAFQRERTHCPSGHEYTTENTYMRRVGWRDCRECNRVRAASRRAAQ